MKRNDRPERGFLSCLALRHRSPKGVRRDVAIAEKLPQKDMGVSHSAVTLHGVAVMSPATGLSSAKREADSLWSLGVRSQHCGCGTPPAAVQELG